MLQQFFPRFHLLRLSQAFDPLQQLHGRASPENSHDRFKRMGDFFGALPVALPESSEKIVEGVGIIMSKLANEIREKTAVAIHCIEEIVQIDCSLTP